MPEDEVVIVAALDELLLVVRQEPVARPALAVLVDERHDVLMLGVVVQVVVLGDGLRVAARLRVRRQVVDLLAADDHLAAVADRLEVLGAGADHLLLLMTLGGRAPGGARL